MIDVLPNARLVGGPLDGETVRNVCTIRLETLELAVFYRVEGSPPVVAWIESGAVYQGATHAAIYEARPNEHTDWASSLHFVRSAPL